MAADDASWRSIDVAKLRADLLAAMKAAESFRAAKSNLRLQLLELDGDGRLTDCEVQLSDDGEHALAFANYGNDARTVYAPFALARRTTEDEFCGADYARRLMAGD